MIVIPIYITFIILYGFFKKKDCFNLFYDGALNGVKTSLKLFPTILALVFSVNVLAKSGFIELIAKIIHFKKIPIEIFIQALLRPISANSSLLMMNTIYQKYGADSQTGNIATLIQGCSDTTIYVLTVYFGFIKIKNTKYALKVGLLTDLITFTTAIILGYLFFKK